MTDLDMGACVRAARLAAGLSQGELAERCGVGQSNVAKWESRSSLRSSTLEKIAQALGTTPDKLIRSRADGSRA